MRNFPLHSRRRRQAQPSVESEASKSQIEAHGIRKDVCERKQTRPNEGDKPAPSTAMQDGLGFSDKRGSHKGSSRWPGVPVPSHSLLLKPTKIGAHDDAKLSLDSRSRQAQPSTVSRTYRDARNTQVFVVWLYAAHKDERMRKQTDKAERWRQAWILHSHAREAWISWERVNRTRPPKSCAVPLPAPLPSDSLPSKPGNMAAQNNANFPGPSVYPQIGVYGPNMSKIRGI